ncbi:MAG: hypothetical protein IPG08_04985 [Sphingobacteriaceae bacterium]|nr:hypothetical protein [Sphingobacteriaceae bacterium]
MKKILLALNIVFISNTFSQSNNHKICGTSEAMDSYYQSNPKSKIDHDNFELFTAEYIKQQSANKSSSTVCYVIPVVFHVYGNVQGGKLVNDTVIQRAISLLNKDFYGLNPDFNTVHTNFMGIRGTMPDITFALAQLDPDGNPTTGIEYYPTTSGYASSTNWPLIAAEAWDNYKYMNIFVQNDLSGSGNYTWGGFSTFPDTAKSNAKLTMIGLNGIYLGYNSGEEKVELIHMKLVIG